jgi:hypothetical protein
LHCRNACRRGWCRDWARTALDDHAGSAEHPRGHAGQPNTNAALSMNRGIARTLLCQSWQNR